MASIPRLFGRPTSRIALDDEDFAEFRIPFLAISEFARQVGNVQGALAPGEFSRFSRRLACGRGFYNFMDNAAGFSWVLFKPLA